MPKQPTLVVTFYGLDQDKLDRDKLAACYTQLAKITGYRREADIFLYASAEPLRVVDAMGSSDGYGIKVTLDNSNGFDRETVRQIAVALFDLLEGSHLLFYRKLFVDDSLSISRIYPSPQV